MLCVAPSRLLIRSCIRVCRLPRMSARRALDRLTLGETFVKCTDDVGDVFALFLVLETITRLVPVPVILVVTAFMLALVMSPIDIVVEGPTPPRLKTSRVKLLTEQTLRRGGGETRATLGTVPWAPVTTLPIPKLGSRLFLLGPVFRVIPTRTLLVPIKHLVAMLKWLEVTRPAPDDRSILLWASRQWVPLLLFLFAPSSVLSPPTVNVNVLRVLTDRVLNDTVFAMKCRMTSDIGLILLTGAGAAVQCRLSRLWRKTPPLPLLMSVLYLPNPPHDFTCAVSRRSATALGPYVRRTLLP